MCVIDETIAFMGGLDLCFGRWDTAQHVLVDETDPNPTEGREQIWRGMLFLLFSSLRWRIELTTLILRKGLFKPPHYRLSFS
jgi:hypothetical protein